MKANEVTIGELFEVAIAAERVAGELYHRLAEKFSHKREVADFWSKYAAEEAGHAKWLEQLRDRLSTEKLSAPADPIKMQEARTALEFSAEHRLRGVQNLEEAYQLVNELENSETNMVFEFLIDNFSADERSQVFLRSQLREHLARLAVEFPMKFGGRSWRQEIKILE